MQFDFTENELKMERFWVSQAALIIRDNKILILKVAENSNWVFPGGRADLGETREVAFDRELKEEINIDHYQVSGVIAYDMFYTANRHVPVCVIANLVDIGDAEIVISSEHSESKWISLSEINDYKFAWPKAKEFIEKAFEMYNK